MNKLYEITDQMAQLWEMLDQDGMGLDDIADTMESLEMDFNDKVSDCVKLQTSLNHDALACKIEGNRLLDRAKRIESRVKWLQDYVMQQMIQAGRPKLQLPEFTVTVRTAVQAVFLSQESAIPDQFIEIIRGIKYDKKAIKAAILVGDDVPGAELLPGKTWLDIR